MKKYCKFNHWHFAGRELLKIIKNLRINAPRHTLSSPYPPSSLERRIRQNTLGLSLNHYMEYFGIESLKTGHFHESTDGERIKLEQTSFSVSKRGTDLTVTPKFLIKRYLLFNITFLKILLLWISKILNLKNTHHSKKIIIKSLWTKDVLKNESLEKFENFCDNFPISHLNEADEIFIGLYDFDPTKVDRSRRVRLCSDPTLQAFKESHFPLSLVMKQISFHLLIWLKFHLLISSERLILLSGDDFAYTSIIRAFISESTLLEVFLPCSEMANQPLYLTSQEGKNFRTSMIWYSSGIAQFSYKHDPYPTADTYYEFMDVDFAYVWEEESKKDLMEYYPQLAPENIQTTGPLTWTIPPTAKTGSTNQLKVVLFDQTPVRQDILEKKIAGSSCFRYGTLPTCEKFMRDIIHAIEQIKQETDQEIKVFLKTKYELTKSKFDPTYKKTIEDFVSLNQLTVLPPEEDIQELINNVDLSLVAPFSSPAYIATSLGKPAIFYDSIDVLDPRMVYARDTLEFVTDPNQLKISIKKLLEIQ